MSQPNVLFVMADQLAPHFTGTYGHPSVSTPHLDALAARGARFDAAYCHSPLCAPARFTMLAGQTVSAIGAWDNASEFPASTPTLAHYLTLAGYRTILSGKMHFVGPDQLHGFEERLTTDIYPADFAWTPNWDQADQRIDKWYHNMEVLHEAGQAVTTYQIDYDEEVGFAARRKLLDMARDDDHRPFFLCASFIHPHDPYVARPEWWARYDDGDIDLPAPWVLEDLDPHTRRIRAGIEADSVGYNDDQLRAARHGYYANVSYFDDWLGKLVTTIEETGQIDNTIIVVTSDHGDMLGDRGSFFKMSFFERSARIPLVIAGPGVERTTIANPCSHLDFLPTLLDIAGAPVDASEFVGRSLWPAARGESDPVNETFGEYTAEMTGDPIFMIRRDNYKYIHCDADPPLLYDVVADPLERSNLAVDPAHADLADSFAREVVARWDSAEIRRRVVASQRSRRVLYEAMNRAPLVSWDHRPANDVANQYIRNHQDWAETGPRLRFPRVPSPDTRA
ncbi:MAG: choline-sulfatase [Acidimicrobiales bacterium]